MRKLLNAVGAWVADRLFPHPNMTIVVNVSGVSEPSRVARVVREELAAKIRFPKG